MLNYGWGASHPSEAISSADVFWAAAADTNWSEHDDRYHCDFRPTASGFTMNEFGVMNVLGGGVAVDTTVNSGGIENVFSSGVTSDTMVNNGGSEILRAVSPAARP